MFMTNLCVLKYMSVSDRRTRRLTRSSLRSIAVVVIGGQMLSLLLTLIATPVVYSLLDDLSHTARWRKLASLSAGLRERFSRKRKRSADAPVEAPAETRSVTEDGRERASVVAGGE